ncbi:hypothetical protein HpMMM63_00200 [Helicobacter pylori]
MEKVCMNAWELPKVLEERLKEKYGDNWEKYVKAKAINEEELEEQVKDKAKEQQKIQREKTLSGFLKKVGLKKRDMLQSTMLFDGVKEADALFQAERKIGDWIFSSAVFFFALALIEAIIIICLLPLKEKVPYLVTFSNATQNFAIVQRADKSIRANQALIRQLVASYVNNRENISNIKEQNEIAHETIRLQSAFEVWDFFEKLVSYEHSIYTNINLTRKISIINIALISKNQANIEISAQLFNKEKLESEKCYRIIMTFEFEPIEIDTKSVPLNPTGFIVTGYDVTEIAILKDLDEKNKVKDDGVKSRIIHTEKKDPHMSQYKDVKEQ